MRVGLQFCRMDYDLLARQVMRALRGARSQTAYSRRLGYRTRVAYAWESGRRAPTAAEMLRAAERDGVDVRAAIAAFLYRQLPGELASRPPGDPAFVAALLRELRGPTPIRVLAERIGVSIATVSRLLAGRTQPRLPTFFRLVDAATRRLLYLLSGLVDLAHVPVARAEWARLTRIHRLLGDDPLFESVPRVLELDDYVRHRPGFIADRLGISRADEERTLAELEAAGLIAWDGTRWRLERDLSVETTRFAARRGVALCAHWAGVGADRVRAGADGAFAYLVFTTDDATLAALRELQVQYFRSFRALAASAQTSTRVAVTNLHLFTIDEGG